MPDVSSPSVNFWSKNCFDSPNSNSQNASPTVVNGSSYNGENGNGYSAIGDELDNCLDSLSDEINCPVFNPAHTIVDKLVTEFYENSNLVTMRILKIKPAENSVKITFTDDSLNLAFKTADSKFLSLYKDTTPETCFVWNAELAEKIVPDECKFCIKNVIEISLKKKDTTKKWSCLFIPPKIQKHVNEPLLKNSIDERNVNEYSSTHVPCCSSSVNALSNNLSDNNYAVKPMLPWKSIFNEEPLPPATKVPLGYIGLRNIGNTCFLNSTLQALVNCVELKRYFCNKYHYLDINVDNPLGMKGELAVAFGEFMKDMWSGQKSVHEPSRIKRLVGCKSNQFMNYGQHDAQEFLSFLLDGLHEDLNRVLKKPITEEIESNGRSDVVIADLSWEAYKSRNDSIIVDLFHGQLKSRLHCPECDRVSITFDPFVYLALPFPKEKITIRLYFWSSDINRKPKRYVLDFPVDYTIAELVDHFASLVNVKAKNLRVMEIFIHRFHKTFKSVDFVKDILTDDIIYVVEVLDEQIVGEPIIEFGVVQRRFFVNSANFNVCQYCQKENKDVQFCIGCYKAAYCNRTCQANDWTKNGHQEICRNSNPELFGQPFYVSLPKSKATYKNIVATMEVLSGYSVSCTRLRTPTNCENDKNNLSETFCENSPLEESSMDVDETGAEINHNLIVENNEKTLSPKSTSLFCIRKCSRDGKTLWNFSHRIADKGDTMIDISNNEYLSMDWINKPNSVELVDKKILDCDVMPSNAQNDKNGELSLYDLLNVYAETEKLSPQEAWYCSKCKKHEEAEKTLLLWRLPPLIVIQFKRFCYSPNVFRNKIETTIDYPVRNLDLSKFLCPGAPTQPTIYDLYAVVCHSGTPYFGHYVGYARLDKMNSADEEIEWRLFDDSHVCPVPESNVVNNNAYLLFYKRRGEDARTVLDQYTSQRPLYDDVTGKMRKLPKIKIKLNMNNHNFLDTILSEPCILNIEKQNCSSDRNEKCLPVFNDHN